MLLKTLLLAYLISPQAGAAPLLVLDPGHEPSRPGAIGVCGKEEVVYNDELAAEVAAALQEGGTFRVLLTRAAGAEVNVSGDGGAFLAAEHRANWAENPRLYERASIANRFAAAALVSLHHDSTAAEYQESAPRACGGKDGKRLGRAFRKKGFRAGFSIFIYKGADQARYGASLAIARAIGAAFRAAGRLPSNYHAEKKDCASCELIDADLGVYHKNLAVVRASDVPAVLVEAGVIVDEADEMAVNRGSFRRRAAKAIRTALELALPR
jgi:N-acetylmuramoyl-L-alanine amidase